jgi:hypothetical protein
MAELWINSIRFYVQSGCIMRQNSNWWTFYWLAIELGGLILWYVWSMSLMLLLFSTEIENEWAILKISFRYRFCIHWLIELIVLLEYVWILELKCLNNKFFINWTYMFPLTCSTMRHFCMLLNDSNFRHVNARIINNDSRKSNLYATATQDMQN